MSPVINARLRLTSPERALVPPTLAAELLLMGSGLLDKTLFSIFADFGKSSKDIGS